MTTKFGTENSEYRWEYVSDIPNRWATYITYRVSGAITRAVVAAVTAVTIVLVLLAGLWLAYTYLPEDFFYILLAVLVMDMALGVVLRAVQSRH